ncbi:flagellar protein FlaG [Halothiobacillus sp.]|uniref:flagellar protein FlaG n=1 Tax=Halothiobacillus sp. TaxID=1891311 RepID=UPI002AD2B3B9|nr:flagellar protein FlaG [Halothiobacillus sp.]
MSSINSVSNFGIPPSSQGRDALSSSPGSSAPSVGVRSQPAPVADSGAVPSPGSGAKAAGSTVQPTKTQVDQVLEGLIKQQAGKPTAVQFSVDEKLNQVVIKVVDPSTQKVIKQFPAEAILKMREDMLNFDSKSLTGLLLSEKT